MMNIQTSSSIDQDKVLEIVASFSHSGKTYWEKRNTIKVFDTEFGKWNVKSFQVPHLINRFAYKYVRKSKARRSFEHAEILLSKGILTPRPIAYVEFSNPVGLTNSFYVSENLEYDFNFEKVIDPHFPDRDNILRQFTRFTFQLHENKIHHFDHSKGNTLMCVKEYGLYDFYLIDLNRMRFEEMSYEMRIDNFNRLSLTEDMIPIIGKEYASLIGKDADKVTEDIRKSCQKFHDFTLRKSRWKKRIGKS
ncbi:lipopolysaccharide kinase InaA family protein [Lutimonas saemankumensis]|uniref:lipopolysaccharide kinase InaA family protein n=1 Tax=Lutimonas saemankumensis TaxID=483016 RepID=UPI001CD452ED|nr:lipopolysaccharide kinase InaA family protein [Lutimonas saemankumensis]MCA0931561.1 lipopolysaccharide kinase InaA family protein [Lutimonas saemankumensis]